MFFFPPFFNHMTPPYATQPFLISVRTYQPFRCSPLQGMQRLLTGQEHGAQIDIPRLPLSTKQLMELQLGKAGLSDDHTYFRDTSLLTSTVLLPNPSGIDLKVVHAHPLLYLLHPETKLVNGHLLITQEQYDASPDGFVLTAADVQELTHNPYALPTRRRAFWEFEAEGDLPLAKAYETYVNDVGKQIPMLVLGLYLPTTKGMQLLCVGCLDGYFGGNGSLVGVAAKAHVVAQKIANAQQWQQSLENLVA